MFMGCKGWSQSGYFPAVGDSMYIMVDRIPENISIDQQGLHSTWDISLAKAPFLRPVIPVSPENEPTGKHFPESDYALRMYDQTIKYYKKEGKELYLLGQYGFIIGQQFVSALVKYDYPFLVNYPSAVHQQSWEYSSTATIQFPASELQPGSLEYLPVSADSIRIVMDLERRTKRDAEGTLKYEIIFDDVVRNFTIENYKYRMLLRVGDKPWQDFTRYVDMEDLFGPSLLYQYDFSNKNYGLPVATVTVNSMTRKPIMVKYWVRSYLDRFQRADQLMEPDIFAFPNPAIGYVNIELNNLKPGKYRIALYNFLAQQVFQMPVKVTTNETVRIDISEFDKGPYLYGLIDQYGRRILTKRLTIMTP